MLKILLDRRDRYSLYCAVKYITGNYTGEGKKIGIVASRFNQTITSSLLDGAVDCLTRHRLRDEDITVCWVPGSMELPLAAHQLAVKGDVDAIICLGAVIRGATAHFDYVASSAATGISSVSLQTNMPVIFGVLTTDTIEQAVERSGSKAGNRGWDAAMAALEMIDVLTRIQNA